MVRTALLSMLVVSASACGRHAFDEQPDALLAPDVPPSPVVGDWPFDDGTGLRVVDTTGNGHDGLLSGGTWTTGHQGTAIELAGDFALVPGDVAFDRPAGASLSITGWVRLSSAPSHSMVLSVSFGPSMEMFSLEIQSATTINYWDGVGHVAEGTVNLAVGEWHHVAVVVNAGGTAITYFDGNRLITGIPDNTPRVATAILIGGSNFNDRFPGALDMVRYYRTALSDAEVAADMAR